MGALLCKSRDRDWEYNIQNYWFRPVVDRNVSSSALLKDFPLHLYQNGRYKQCPYIVGFTKNEGSLEYYLQLDRVSNRTTTEEKIAFLKDYAFENIIFSAIKHQYFSRNQSRNALNSQYFNSVNNQRVNAITSNRQLPYNPQQPAYQSGAIEQDTNRILVEVLISF
jgi:carboxylesterase type B